MKNKQNTKDTEVDQVLEEAKRKLLTIESNQKKAEKYFTDKEIFEGKLKLIETSLKKKVRDEKKSPNGIDQRDCMDKMESLLKTLVLIDPKVLLKMSPGNFEMKQVQTDDDDSQMIREKIVQLEKQHEENMTKRTQHKQEIALLKNQVDNLKVSNEKLTKEKTFLQINLDEAAGKINKLEKELKEVVKTNQSLSEQVIVNENALIQYNELKTAMEDRIALDAQKEDLESERIKELREKMSGSVLVLATFKLMHNVTQFLLPKEIIKLQQTSKAIHDSINRSIKCKRDFYCNIIKGLNAKLVECSQFDISKEYLINDTEMERLIKEYVTGKKHSGKELRNTISKCLTFLNKDVKTPLGIKVSNSSTPKTGDKSGNKTPTYNNLMGGFKSMFGYLGGPSANTSAVKEQPSSNGSNTPSHPYASGVKSAKSPGSKGDSLGTSVIINSSETTGDMDKMDKFIISENIIHFDYDFDYSNPDEIKILLNKYLKSPFSTEKLTAFIKEMCVEYSELLYYANKTSIEVRDLDVIKTALNERFTRYHKLYSQLEKDYSADHGKNNSTAKTLTFKEEKVSDKSDVSQEIELFKQHKLVSDKKHTMLVDKYNETHSEYEAFKVVFMKEIRNLKFDLDQTIRQRDQLKETVINFKNYFNLLKIKE